MTADEFWRAARIAREFGPAAPSALPVSEVEALATAPSPGEVVVTVLHVGDSRVVPPSEESPAITPSGVVADVAQPSEEAVVPPSSPAPVEVPADPCLLYTSPSPRDGLLSRMPSSA